MNRPRVAPPSPEPFAHRLSASLPGETSAQQHLRRTLRLRPAESAVNRFLSGSAGLFRSDDYPQRLTEAAAGTQLPVTTGRRIAVVGSRGGAGKTSVSAVLARIYAAMRADAVAVLDNAPEAGTLGRRMGVPDAPSLDAVAAGLGAGPPASLHELAGLLAVAGPANLLVTGRRYPRAWTVSGAQPPVSHAAQDFREASAWTPAGPAAGAGGSASGSSSGRPGGSFSGAGSAAAALVSCAVSRYCPVTIVDCGPGLSGPDTRWALEHAHVALFVAPASIAGLDDAAEYAAHWNLDPGQASVPLLVLVVQSSKDSTVAASRAAADLRRAGIDAMHLGHDRHLAAGMEIDPSLLSRRSRLEAVSLASRVLSAAISGPAVRRPRPRERRWPAAVRGPAAQAPA